MDDIFVGCFDDLEDPRVARTKKHLLLDIIAISISSFLARAENWEEIEDLALDPIGSQTACLNWFKQVSTLLPETVIAVDGKSIRQSKQVNACQSALHILNAWSFASGLCLGLLKKETSFKASIRRKQRKACTSLDYLSNVIALT